MTTNTQMLGLNDGKHLYFEQDAPMFSGQYPVRSQAGQYPIGIENVAGGVDFDAALAVVKTAANDLIEALKSIPSQPKSCELTFGLKLSTQLGFIVAKANGEANFQVKLTWEAEKAEG